MKPKQRKIILWSAAPVGSLAILFVALPLWFPWLLGPLGRKEGLHYAAYVREGYSRFRLERVAWTNGGIHVTAGHIELFTPAVWLWHHLRSDRTESYATVNNWSVRINSSANAAPAPNASTYTNAQHIAAVLAKIDRWIPKAVLTNGSLQIKGRTIGIADFIWQQSKLRSTVRPGGFSSNLLVEADVGQIPWQARARYLPLSVEMECQARPSSSNLAIRGIVSFRTNHFEISGSFARAGSLPERATLECPSFSVPAHVLGLDRYGDIKGTISLLWDHNSFAANVRADASPPENSPLPPVNVELKAQGDADHAIVNTLNVSLPGIHATLATNLTFPLPANAPPAILNISANLAQQPWLPLSGSVHGQIGLSPGTNLYPHAAFSLVATNVGTSRIKASRVLLAGNFDSPSLELREARIEFAPPNGVASLSGNLDIARKEIRHGEIRFSGSPPAGLLPAAWQVSDLSCSSEFDGPVADLRHKTELNLHGLISPLIHPLDANILATGQGQKLEITAALAQGSSIAHISLSASPSARTNAFLLKTFDLTSKLQPLLTLQEPVWVHFVSSPTATGRPWQLKFSPIALAGPNRKLTLEADLRWPDQGHILGSVSGLALRDFQDLLTPKWNGVQLHTLRFESEWQNGPATIRASLDGAYSEGPEFTMQTDIRGDATGLSVSNLTVASQSTPVITAIGFLPMTLNPANPTNFLRWREGQGLNFKANMQPDPRFWQRLFELTRVQIVQPKLNIDVSGPWNSPTGWVHASVSKASLNQTNRPLPTVEDFQLNVQLDAKKVRVHDLHFLVHEQPVLISAEFPLDAQFYDSLARRKTPDWTRGSGRLRIQHAPVASFIRYLPRLLMPPGTLDMDISLQPGGTVDGHVMLQGATTYALGEFGAIRDINASLRLHDRAVTLDHVRGSIGGEPLQATGSADLTDLGFLRGQIPPFDLKLNGRNIPLVRKPDVIIRSDLALAVVHSKTNQPIVSGTVTMRDSFYTADLESLIHGSLAKPTERPPYFSVEAEPIAGWRLDCRVRGDKSLKLRTPFFSGTLSADFKLEGTLREPLASGEARISTGQVEFPFGTLDVKQGFVSLTAGNPYQPQIYVNARARRFGYDITLEVTGSADKPLIQFSSVPSLSSQQIFLLLTAGELPRDEITFTPQQRAQRFAVYLGQRFLAKLGFGGGSERLTIRSGEDVSESGRLTYDVEYKLDRDWSIVGQYDRFNAFNLSLKRRIFSR